MINRPIKKNAVVMSGSGQASLFWVFQGTGTLLSFNLYLSDPTGKRATAF